ncbi:DUF5994 family protein [Streptomyces sp. NPDC041068]|uniref:DUF5994 family protein n=1 Tax=Streptomyces sp. NPDC041068 TaxID=3155130 RepID=UPI0033E30D3B
MTVITARLAHPPSGVPVSDPAPARFPLKPPDKVRFNGHTVEVGWDPEKQDTRQLRLLSCRVGRWDLVVVPPGTDADATAPRRRATLPWKSRTA